MRLRISLIIAFALAIMLTGCDVPLDEQSLEASVAATLVALNAGEPQAAEVPEDPVEPADPGVPADPIGSPATAGVLTIAYISGGNVWYVETGSLPQQLTTHGDVEQVDLSTDGQWVGFLRFNLATGVYELRSVNTATSVETVLLTQGDLDGMYPLGGALHHVPYQFEFVPGTHTIYMNTRDTFEGPGLQPNNDLWSIDAETGARTALLAPGLAGDFYISPSGLKLALVLPTSIGFANIDGSGRSPDHLTFPFVITYSEYAYYPIPVWAADDSSVTVVIPPEDPFASTIARVWQVPVTGAPASLVDLTGFNYFRNQQRTPMLAPDLSKAAFLRETAPNVFDLVLTPLNGSPESIYVSGDITWKGWNPDSTHFAFGDAPRNLLIGGVGLPSMAAGFGGYLHWVDTDTYLYLDQLTATHRFSRVDVPSPAVEVAVISGSIFDYDFTE